MRKLDVTARVVAMVVCRHLRRWSLGAEFQRKRRSSRRHESDRYIGSERQRDQYQTDDQFTVAVIEKASLHGYLAREPLP
jgi:hypothetical protein